MKTNKFIRCLAIALIMIMVHGSLCAQVRYNKVKQNTYVFDNSKCIVYNNAKKASAKNIVTDGFEIKKSTIIPDAFKEVLSSQRIKELKGEKLAVTLECDKEGKVENVKFVFTKAPFLTPVEINEIETIILSKKFTVKSDLADDVGIRFSIPCFFSKLLK